MRTWSLEHVLSSFSQLNNSRLSWPLYYIHGCRRTLDVSGNQTSICQNLRVYITQNNSRFPPFQKIEKHIHPSQKYYTSNRWNGCIILIDTSV